MITEVYYGGTSGAMTSSFTQGLRIAEYNFPRPAVKTYTVDVPGRDGLVDLSAALTGYPTFENVIGTVRFIVLKGSTFNLKSFINTYHGQLMRIATNEDYPKYRIGRATVTAEELKLGKLRTFTLTMNAEPFLWNALLSSQTFNVKTGSTTGFTSTATSNMATGYPSIATKNITLKAASDSGGSATFTVPVDDSKLYVLTCTMNDYCEGYKITTGNGYVTGTQLIKPKSGDTTATVEFTTKGTTSNAVFSNICLLPLEEVTRDTTVTRTSTPFLSATTSCVAYVAMKNRTQTTYYALSLGASTSIPDIVPIREDSGGQTGIYVGIGLASSNSTATLYYRGGVLA